MTASSTRRYGSVALASLLGASSLAMAQSKTDAPTTLETLDIVSDAITAAAYMPLDREPEVGKMDVPAEEQPYSVSVIDRTFIEDTGAKNIQDALLYTPGVYAGAFGHDTRIDSAKVRGVDAGRYVDGLRQIYGSYNTVRTNVYALESIEVLKGPSSMLYGQGDLGGIINAVSKLPQAEQDGEVWAQYGTFNRKQLALDITGPATKDGDLLYRVVALGRDSDTQVDYVENDGYVLAPSLTWRPNEGTSVTLLLNRQENTGQVSSQFLPQEGTLEPGSQGYIGSDRFVGEPGWDRYDREKTEATLFVDQQLSDNWAVAATARYTDSSTETREHWVKIGDKPDANGEVERTIYTTDRATQVFNVDARLEGNIELGATRHNLIIGADRQDALWEEWNNDSGDGGTFDVYNPEYGNLNASVLNPSDAADNEIEQIGLYVADHMEFGPVVVSTGLRHDWAENRELAVSGTETVSEEESTTGRIGVMYRFENGVSPYISYAEAFSMNLGTDGAGGILKPNTGEQQEAGIKYVSPDRSMGVTVAYFDIIQENRVSQGATPGGVQQTGAVIHGWELQLNKRWNRFETQVAFTDMNAKDDSTDNRLPYVAERQASWWNQLYVASNWRLGAGVRYIGDNVGWGGNPVVPSVTLYDAMVGYTWQDWEFSVDAKNLADEEYISWCRSEGADCGYGERRTVNANARYRF
ncbi:TonB-dependent siderophore receptor [Marinobacter nauticus]